jgi:hypothetical protein
MSELAMLFVIMAGMATVFFVAYLITLTYHIGRLAIWETGRIGKKIFYKIKEII